MAKVVSTEDLRSRLGQELDSLKTAKDVLYVSRRGRLAGVLVGVDRYAELLDRIEFLEDSVAALQARNAIKTSLGWTADTR